MPLVTVKDTSTAAQGSSAVFSLFTIRPFFHYAAKESGGDAKFAYSIVFNKLFYSNISFSNPQVVTL